MTDKPDIAVYRLSRSDYLEHLVENAKEGLDEMNTDLTMLPVEIDSMLEYVSLSLIDVYYPSVGDGEDFVVTQPEIAMLASVVALTVENTTLNMHRAKNKL